MVVIPWMFVVPGTDGIGIMGNDLYPNCLKLKHSPQPLTKPNCKIIPIEMHEVYSLCLCEY